MAVNRYLRLNRLRILRSGKAAYDQSFHDGVNIIRGENGSGKSTIADFIFYVLGGEFDDWKEAAGTCDEVQAEIETARGKITLKRPVGKSTTNFQVFFGPLESASEHALEGWEQFPLRRQGHKESFSQIMFRSLEIPEAQSEGASNITMHQLLRLCYSDQRTPAARLFRFEQFDTQGIREAVGDLICGISGFDLYEVGLRIREAQKELSIVESRLNGLLESLPSDDALRTPALVHEAIAKLEGEKQSLQKEIDTVDDVLEAGEVREYLDARKKAQQALGKQREKVNELEVSINNIELEIRELNAYLAYLSDLSERLIATEHASEVIGAIEFSHCPACGAPIEADTESDHCVVCKSPSDPEEEQSRYNQIRLDLEIQTRETNQLSSQKDAELSNLRRDLREFRRAHERDLTEFDISYSGGTGPRDAFLGERSNRLGYIDAEIDYLTRSLNLAEEIERLQKERNDSKSLVDSLVDQEKALQREVSQRRSVALGSVSKIGASLLRADDNRQDEFQSAGSVGLNFVSDAILVDGLVNFAESSNVYLKNTAILSLLLASGEDSLFYHPNFVLLDNIEDKGMEPQRSHLFQRLIVERATEIESPYQIIFTTSMMNPELELEDYVIGPFYTHENRSLDLEL